MLPGTHVPFTRHVCNNTILKELPTLTKYAISAAQECLPMSLASGPDTDKTVYLTNQYCMYKLK